MHQIGKVQPLALFERSKDCLQSMIDSLTALNENVLLASVALALQRTCRVQRSQFWKWERAQYWRRQRWGIGFWRDDDGCDWWGDQRCRRKCEQRHRGQRQYRRSDRHIQRWCARQWRIVPELQRGRISCGGRPCDSRSRRVASRRVAKRGQQRCWRPLGHRRHDGW